MAQIYYMNYCGDNKNIFEDLETIGNSPLVRVLDRSMTYHVVIETEEHHIRQLLASLPNWIVSQELHEFHIGSPLPITKIDDL